MHRLCPPWHASARVALAALTLAATLASTAAAADPLQTVITARRPAAVPRPDVLTACPDIADTLERELSPAVRMLGQEGTVRVELRLQGDRVWEVRSSGGPQAYRQPIRRALRALSCTPGSEGERFVFAIRFELQPAAPGPQRLAQLVAP